MTLSSMRGSGVTRTFQNPNWKVGDRVEVQWNNDWFAARIIEANGDQYKIHYDGYADSWDEWVGKARMRTVSGGVRQQSPQTQGNDSSQSSQIVNLLTQAQEKLAAGQPDEAIQLAERALKISADSFGPQHLTVVLSLATLAQIYDRKSDPSKAQQYYLRAVSIAEKDGSGIDPGFLSTTLLNGLAQTYEAANDFEHAAPLYKRALDLQERTVGPNDGTVATTVTNLGVMYQKKGDYAQAERLLQRALKIRQQSQGEEIFIIQSLKSLASLYETTGDYEKSGELMEQTVTRLEKLVGKDSPLIAPALSDLALHYKNEGDFLKAEETYQRSIAIFEKAGGPNSPALATPLDNLGNVYKSKGDYPRAEALFKRALTIMENAKADEIDTATTLNNLAVMYEEQQKYELAEPLELRALAIKEKTLGSSHPEIGPVLNNLTVLYFDKGDYGKAVAFGQRALAITEKGLGPNHPDVAIALNNLAALQEDKHDYQQAEGLYLRALSIEDRKLGPKHPDTGYVVFNLALLEARRKNMHQAMAYLTRGADISEYNASLILTSGSEEQKRRYMATLATETDFTISFHLGLAPDDPAAARLALTTILRRKGRALDAMTEQLTALRRRSDPQDLALLEKLVAARSQLANLTLSKRATQNAEAIQTTIKELEAEADRLEAAVSARSAQFRSQSQPVTVDSVRNAMPTNTALIEITSFRPFNIQAQSHANQYGPAHYAAYVLTQPGAVRFVDLGESSFINAAVAEFRKQLRSPRTTGAKEAGRQVYEKVMRPVVPLLGETHQLFLSPDGDLNLIPFSALVDEKSRYLIENYSITYLTSGRDLLRLQVHAAARAGPTIFANPAFNNAVDDQTRGGEDSNSGRRSVDFRNTRFSPLPGTAGEASALSRVLTGVRLLTGAQATEAAIKQLSAPEILHIATHGFFLPDGPPSENAAVQHKVGATTDVLTNGENPLVRSGLALAGVNQRQSGPGEDGVLTALEMAGLDLWGTKLVVLSACETALGEVRNGEGVYGLRRALVLAGSESQVMSLWQVSDAATRDLMTAYYKRLQAGEGRSDALRNVQLAMLRGETAEPAAGKKTAPGPGEQRGIGVERGQAKPGTEGRSHPFYWASFIQSGDWRKLN